MAMTVDNLKSELEARNELKSGNKGQGVVAPPAARGDFAGADEEGARTALRNFWLGQRR